MEGEVNICGYDIVELRMFRPKACSPDGDSPEAKDDSPDDTNQWN